ncbi:MAG: hypothetical protein RL497_255 [Pseudomonadota bacterium]|jgi:hypothetical protein
MKKLIAVFALIVLVACSQMPSTKNNFSKTIVGTWYFDEQNPDGSRSYFEKTYKADGTASGYMTDTVIDALGVKKVLSRTEFTSRWRIEENMLFITDAAYSDGTKIEKILDKILEITKEKSVLQSVDTGDILIRYRKK